MKLCIATLIGKMGRRWIEKEEKAIAQIRETLKDELTNRPQFPDGIFVNSFL